jgi:oligo-alginate lyase
MGHGHFDKLSWQYYDNGHEIVSDYGAARFLNIEAKHGGRYLPENESWGKQTVAHNTLVVDAKSHFDGDTEAADKLAPEQLYFSDRMGSQISTAKMPGAYPDVEFTRTLALLDVDGLGHPLVANVMRVKAEGNHQYDLPLHYNGHITRVGFNVNSNVEGRPVLGKANGYQHIWVDATGKPTSADNAFVTWINDNRFYTARWVPQAGSQAILAESGANDPEFNLRREPMIIQRVTGAKNTSFASILESHGLYDGAAEQTVESDSQIKSLSHESVGDADILFIETLAGKKMALAISYDRDPKKKHRVEAGGQTLNWTGFAARIDLPSGKAAR